MSNAADLIQAYSADPIGLGTLDTPTCTHTQGNTVCGDFITVFLHIEDDKVVAFKHSGDPQMFTLAATSMLAEEIIGASVDEVMSRGGAHMKGLGLTVSSRRKRSTVTGLLAVHNAILTRKNASEIETYEQILSY